MAKNAGVKTSVKATSALPGVPKSAFFRGERQSFLHAWNPQLRENRHDVREAWQKSAARATEALQNSGFIAGGAEASSATVVGSGLRLSVRPDGAGMGWSPERTQAWGREIESRWSAYSTRPTECDAAGKMTVSQMQQAAYASYICFGESVALLPMIQRRGVQCQSKVALIPASRLVNKTSQIEGLHQGVYVDAWGMPEGYLLKRDDEYVSGVEYNVAARDADGRPNVLHVMDPAVASTRGISPLATVLKVIKQVDQYCDATLTTALIQTIFAATMRTNVQGLDAYAGLMTSADASGSQGALDIPAFANAKGEWYQDAKVDLAQHGRIAHLFPGDELDFKSAQHPNSQFDTFMRWLLMEVARGFGLSYETLTGDYRGATYSSVRMAGAMEWLTVNRRRDNLIVPFVQTIYENWLEEEIGTGRLGFPGGLRAFYQMRGMACHTIWTGPPRPQADEFKAARAQQVLKEIGATTMAHIAADYGMDWDDVMRQQKAENDLADELDLPRPWAPTDIMQKPDGEEIALNAPADGNGDRKDPKKTSPKQGAGRNPGDEREPEGTLESELEGDDNGD